MKRLILCNDGTWNTPDQEENGIPAPTNVVKLYNSLLDKDEEGVVQLKYYHPGVGTNGLLDKITGGSVGVGVGNQIRSAYHWIATNYSPGDDIYLFGFSRGAFIARSLAGFLGRGLLDLRDEKLANSKESWDRVVAAYEKGYRKYPSLQADPRNWVKSGWTFFNGGAATPVRLVGVWDTVGALGVPDDLELLNLFDNSEAWRFHDTELGQHIITARHAMAIDEIRASFTVTRWTNTRQHSDAKEIWFPGVHADVGGGYSNSNLSDGALLWMIEESESTSLGFRAGIKDMIQPNPLGCLHNSYKGGFAKLRARPRSVDALIPANHAKFHASAIQRQVMAPISYPPYCPTRILAVDESFPVDIHADTHWNVTALYLAKDHQYIFSAAGEWLDSKDACDWKGTQNDNFTFSDIVRAGSSFFGKTETFLKKITENPSTDLIGTKRVEEFPWFTLVGAIANDSGIGAKLPNDGSPNPHQYANLPLYQTKTNPLIITNPGYLYCFANDVWSLYGNNHGCVRLTVTRIA